MVDTLAALVTDEPRLRVVGEEPRHAAEYLMAVGGRVLSGPAFTFPRIVGGSHREREGVVLVEDLATVSRHFAGWSAQEIAGRQPIVGILEHGDAVCLCFCARRSETAAEAGIETAEPHRGRGLAPRAAAAWAAAVRAEGLVPLYSTQWTNAASLSVARTLGLETVADDWSLVDP